MRNENQHITILLRQLTFVFIVCVMAFQPISQTLPCLVDSNYEIVDHDWDEDTDKEESEDSSKDKKIEPQLLNTSVQFCNLKERSTTDYAPYSKWSLSMEIFIPPPDLT